MKEIGRRAFVVGGALHVLERLAIAREENVTMRTAEVPIEGSLLTVPYRIIGDIRGGMMSRDLAVFSHPLLNRGEIFQHSKVREALGDDVVGMIIQDPLEKKRTAMDWGHMTEAVINKDPDCSQSRNIIAIGASGGALNTIGLAALDERVKLCILLSPQGDLAVKKYADLVDKDELRKLNYVRNNSGLVGRAKHAAAMHVIRGVAQSPQTVFEKFIEPLSQYDENRIAQDPELKALLFDGFRYYSDQTPTPEGIPSGALHIRNGIWNLFARGVPRSGIPKNTLVDIYTSKDDSYVNPVNSELMLEEWKNYGINAELSMFDGDSQLEYFNDKLLKEIVEKGKRRLRHPAVAMRSSAAGGVQHDVLDKDD